MRPTARALAFAGSRGIEEIMLPLAASIASPLVELGAWDEFTGVADGLAPRLEEAGDVWDLSFLQGERIRVLARRGDMGAAALLAGWAEQKAREIGHAQQIALVFPPAGAVRLGQGDASGALSLLVELERTPNVRDDPSYARNLPDAVRTALAAGDPELAARLVEGLEPRHPLHEPGPVATTTHFRGGEPEGETRVRLAEHKATDEG